MFPIKTSGGPVTYFSKTLASLGNTVQILTKLPHNKIREYKAVFPANVHVTNINTDKIHKIKIIYTKERRKIKQLEVAAPYSRDEIANIISQIRNLGIKNVLVGNIFDDFRKEALSFIQTEARKSDTQYSADIQGFLRSPNKNFYIDKIEKENPFVFIQASQDETKKIIKSGIYLYTKGSEGSEIYHKGKLVETIPAFKVPIVDETGCGDVLFASFNHYLFSSKNINLKTAVNCAYYASAAASFKVESEKSHFYLNKNIIETRAQTLINNSTTSKIIEYLKNLDIIRNSLGAYIYGSFIFNGIKGANDIDVLLIPTTLGCNNKDIISRDYGKEIHIYKISSDVLKYDINKSSLGGYHAGKLLVPFVALKTGSNITELRRLAKTAAWMELFKYIPKNKKFTLEELVALFYLRLLLKFPYLSKFVDIYFNSLENTVVKEDMKESEQILDGFSFNSLIKRSDDFYKKVSESKTLLDVFTDDYLNIIKYWRIYLDFHNNSENQMREYIKKAKNTLRPSILEYIRNKDLMRRLLC